MWVCWLVSALVILGFDLARCESSSQIPLSTTVSPLEASPWRLNFSSTAPYLFSSVSSLLQQWGNTFFPNGHAVVPCEIPAYTLFFHGRLDGELPPSPEWLAFDIEMSYGIMGSTRNSHMLTYQTTRPVRALYFDGESAALMGLGQLDTQMLHVFSNLSGPPHNNFRGLFDEYARATGLCDWLLGAGLRGDGWGYEGIVRMNAGFEMIWCNFTSPSLRLLTRLNVTAPQLPKKESSNGDDQGLGLHLQQRQETSYYSLPSAPTKTERATDPSNPPMPPNWRWDFDREPFLRSQGWGWFSSATYHYGASRNGPGLGEVRAKTIDCGIMSYYSPSFSNLTLTRSAAERELYNLTEQGYWQGESSSGNRTLGLTQIRRRRRYHHLGHATSQDAMLMRNTSERVLRDLLAGNHSCSGADWTYITNEISQSVGIHLKELSKVLDSFHAHSQNYTTVMNWMSILRSQSHTFYVGFLEYPEQYTPSVWGPESKLFTDTYSRCRYRYSRLMVPSEGIELSPEEGDIKWAVEETYGAVCFVLLTIGFQIEEGWASYFNQLKPDPDSTAEPIQKHYGSLAATWSDGVQQLMAWLGWEDEFTGCAEVCAWDERCYIPMWPLMRWTGGDGPPRRPSDGNGTYPGFPPYGGHGYGGPNRGGPNRGRPGGRRWGFMGDETELWEPTCAKVSHFMR
ncbi:uncharacterized protein BCR38DRAFT_413995 [Pseudomassariella vexata]|uniref:Uncharacterized protein n=1 Tax=Pseudomassariella vexata TaxID=1141098 RepID=A0A1Y2DCZ1_9PEZI|nr:uncharacterized protein BCR38DRAFT_413995 [Pseudomassariella vexata]ORY57140.1 hypothetical protein BCR38DRAFT_413995 [Pseudomassariella vexata]